MDILSITSLCLWNALIYSYFLTLENREVQDVGSFFFVQYFYFFNAWFRLWTCLLNPQSARVIFVLTSIKIIWIFLLQLYIVNIQYIAFSLISNKTCNFYFCLNCFTFWKNIPKNIKNATKHIFKKILRNNILILYFYF